MKLKTSNLKWHALDWAVHVAMHGKCEGYPEHHYSADWAHGGPIIERECITVECQFDRVGWTAWTPAPEQPDGEAVGAGDTALIAAMRCYVASKLGDEVDIPKELLEDGQEIGIDGDGAVICWDATKQEPYNSGQLGEDVSIPEELQ